MKKYLLLALFLSALSSCATRPDGTRTFAGLDGGQWGHVGLNVGTTYLETRRPPGLSAKTAEDVNPQEALRASWLDLGIALLGL